MYLIENHTLFMLIQKGYRVILGETAHVEVL